MRPLLAILLLLAMVLPARAAGPDGDGWERMSQPPFTFHYRAKDERLAEGLAGIAGDTLARIVDSTGQPPPGHVDVVLAPDAATFAAVQPSPPPVWAAGTAWPERSEIYLRTRLPRIGPNRIGQVFTHEAVHLVLGMAWDGSEPPRWLQEGMASYLARELEPGDHAVLLRSALCGGLLPLSSFVDRWPSGAARARVAYVQSVDFVAFLDRQGNGVLPDVVGRLARGEPLPSAVRAASGEDLASLEARWRSRITIWHAILPVAGSSGMIWGLTAALFMVAAARRRRAVKLRIAEMEPGPALSAPEQPW